MSDNQDKTDPSTQQSPQPEQTKPDSGQHQEHSPFINVEEKPQSSRMSALVILTLLMIVTGIWALFIAVLIFMLWMLGIKISVLNIAIALLVTLAFGSVQNVLYKVLEKSNTENTEKLISSLSSDNCYIFSNSEQKRFRKAAVSGNSSAQWFLALCLAKGRGGFAHDDVEAVKWFKEAAEAGNSNGMNNLGNMYEQGRGGLGKDDVEAVKWYRKAAEAGNSDSMNRLGVMYATGRGGLAQDEEEAVKWYKQSAEAGDSAGMGNLGNMYATGRGGLVKDDNEAVKLFNKSAEAEYAQNLFKLEITNE